MFYCIELQMMRQSIGRLFHFHLESYACHSHRMWQKIYRTLRQDMFAQQGGWRLRFACQVWRSPWWSSAWCGVVWTDLIIESGSTNSPVPVDHLIIVTQLIQINFNHIKWQDKFRSLSSSGLPHPSLGWTYYRGRWGPLPVPLCSLSGCHITFFHQTSVKILGDWSTLITLD